MKLFVSGLINVETNLQIRSFPVTYYPIDYPFFGIKSAVSGVGYNIVKAASTLGDDVSLCSMIGKDAEGARILETLCGEGIDRRYIFESLDTTPVSVVLHEPREGKRQIYCDLKNIQEKSIDTECVMPAIENADICALCNTNFNRALIPVVKNAGKPIATDVHVICDIHDSYNRDFMQNADILFLSDEDLPCSPQEFLTSLKNEYGAEIIVMGLGSEGVIMYERAYDAITSIPAVNIGGVVNTVGAGDALFTSFLHYYRSCGALDAIKRAEVFAALKIRHDGGSIGFPTAAEVEEVFGSYRF